MPKKTKWVRYTEPAVNPRTTCSFMGYRFTYRNDLSPIPLEVPEDIAELLLEMESAPCNCHFQVPHKLFEEVPPG